MAAATWICFQAFPVEGIIGLQLRKVSICSGSPGLEFRAVEHCCDLGLGRHCCFRYESGFQKIWLWWVGWWQCQSCLRMWGYIKDAVSLGSHLLVLPSPPPCPYAVLPGELRPIYPNWEVCPAACQFRVHVWVPHFCKIKLFDADMGSIWSKPALNCFLWHTSVLTTGISLGGRCKCAIPQRQLKVSQTGFAEYIVISTTHPQIVRTLGQCDSVQFLSMRLRD